MWVLPDNKDKDNLVYFARDLGCVTIKKVPIMMGKSYYLYDDCHNNVLQHVEIFGGDRVVGFYFIVENGVYQAIYHSVWRGSDGNLYDITPYRDQRPYNIFGISANQVPNYKKQQEFFFAR